MKFEEHSEEVNALLIVLKIFDLNDLLALLQYNEMVPFEDGRFSDDIRQVTMKLMVLLKY